MLLLEYLEEAPPLLARPGMGLKLTSYYKKMSDTDTGAGAAATRVAGAGGGGGGAELAEGAAAAVSEAAVGAAGAWPCVL